MLLLGKSIGVEQIDIVVDQKLGADRHSSLANPCIEDEDQTNLLRRYLQCGFKFKYLKNNSERITAVCSHRDDRGCLWLSSNLVSNVISERVRDRPLTRSTDVAYTFKGDCGLDISYHVAWLGVEKARKAMHVDYLTSFDQLRWYGDVVQHYNPVSHINIDYDLKTSQFKRFFVAFPACINGFKYCRLLLFHNGIFLKGRYKGQLLAATAKDGNQGLFPLAFAIVDSESESNWSWFLYELSKVITADRCITFVSDRNLGLLEAMPKAFSSAYHGWCLQHLKNNFRDKLKGMENGFKEYLIRKLGDCANEPTVTGFHALLEELKSEGKQCAYNFLSGLEPEHWANAYFRGQQYGEMTSNNNWIKEALNLSITKLVDTVRNQIMRQMLERMDIANKWNGIICPTFETNLQDSFNTITVDIGHRVCSYYQWQVNGFPCEHVVAAIQRSAYNLNDCAEKYFNVENYREAYAAAIFPIPSMEKPTFSSSDFIKLPPIVKRSAGRLRKSRIPSREKK
ncbi:uncharacterized protein LOC114289766 [Camellia sinensis]|uniref:uncharacterized protein LOC114289766 n=1 Tax=Camellia sinensis TaxID=4442 RepID=UPI001035B2DB|nr:uncharacterized protein LOC114289766 [Camellia sinensis]